MMMIIYCVYLLNACYVSVILELYIHFLFFLMLLLFYYSCPNFPLFSFHAFPETLCHRKF